MQIATWNVNSIRTRQEHVCNWLSANPVDFLCLQETKVVDADFPRTPFEDLGYHLQIWGQKAYNGVAIFSREPIADVKMGFAAVLGSSAAAEEFDAQKRAIALRIADFWLVNLYVPNGSSVGSEKYDYKLRWLATLQDYLTALQTEGELCVCGDFNVAPEDRDIYKPEDREKHIMASPAEREALQSVLSIGLADAFRKFIPETGHYSWWDYRQGGFARDRGWRIDHIYLTPKLYDRAARCWIDREPRGLPKPSDHTPVTVELTA
ncbi:MAG: exodeoxyribonuclease III [Cyanobacteria bacterium J06641_5]